jgi:hypothetical protein
MSRRSSYYDFDPNVRSDATTRGRTFIGQIESVRPEDGVVQVRVEGINESRLANIPLWGMYYDGGSSSWSRYMPPPGATVRLGFGPRNEMEILNYVVYGEDSDAQGDGGSREPRLGGYKALTRFARNNTNRMRIWRDLRPGEFDLRSSGGAGYYFTQDGRAILEAGVTALELDKASQEARLSAFLTVMGEYGAEVRFGDVKRTPLGGAIEEPVDIDPSVAVLPKEWRVRLAAQPFPGADFPLFEDHAGDIREGTPLQPVRGASGLPLRRRTRTYDPSGLFETLKVQVDVQGNIEVEQIATATFGLSASFFKANIATVTSASIAAGTTLDLGGQTGVNINAGGEADDGIVKGQALSTYLTEKLKVPTAWGLSGSAILPLSSGVEYSLLGKVK